MRQVTIPACRVEKNWEGKYSVQLPDGAREMVQVYFKTIYEKHAGFTGIVLVPPKKRRSTGKKSQNHHLNGHIQQISVQTGQPFEDVKRYVKQRAITMGYPILEDEDGIHLLDLWGNVRGISETDSSVEECAIAIEAAHLVAAELDIDLIETEAI